jgi:hypothetical protein
MRRDRPYQAAGQSIEVKGEEPRASALCAWQRCIATEWLGDLFREARQRLGARVRERADRGLAAPRASNDRLRDALADFVLLSVRILFTNAIERDVHVGQRSRVETAFNHFALPAFDPRALPAGGFSTDHKVQGRGVWISRITRFRFVASPWCDEISWTMGTSSFQAEI